MCKKPIHYCKQNKRYTANGVGECMNVLVKLSYIGSAEIVFISPYRYR